MQYGEDSEPLGEQIGSRVIALLASHVDSPTRLDALRRCLRSVEAQTEPPARFVVSTSSDPDLTAQVAEAVQNSPCVDEHLAQGSGPLPQFEHYRRLRDVVFEREERLEDAWVFFSDDDDLWHPDRTRAFAAAAEAVRRRVQRHVQAVCSCVHLRPRAEGGALTCAIDVCMALARGELAHGPREYGSEHIDLCVRLSTFGAFFEEHSSRVTRHKLADVRFCYYVRHYGEVPRRMGDEDGVMECDITDPDATMAAVKVFLPEAKDGVTSNWMYMYDKVRDPHIHAVGTGTAVEPLHPDDGWYVGDLEKGASACERTDPKGRPCPHLLLQNVAAIRQRLDYAIFRLPRHRLVMLEHEVLGIADAASSSEALAGLLWRQFGNEVVGRWVRRVALSRCKALKVEVFSSTDFCVVCGREAHLRCSVCRVESYCSVDCQWDDWQKTHRVTCVGRGALGTSTPGFDREGAASQLAYDRVD